MKILFITAWYPNENNPAAGIFVQEHAKAVSQFGNEVVVLHAERAKGKIKGLYNVKDNIEDGIRTIRIFYSHSQIRTLNYLIYLWSNLGVSQKLIRTGFRPEVIHAHIFSAGIPAVLLSIIYRIPIVITEHSSAFPMRSLSQVEIFQAKLAFRWAKIVLPVSSVLQIAIENYGIKARFKVIPNVVDTSVFYPPPHLKEINCPKRILFTGLLVPIKGLSCLLDSLVQLRRQRDDWHLDIVGDGPARLEYENKALNLTIAEKVTFHGLKSKGEVAEFMQGADIFVLPSFWENSPCVLLEAMASGLPIVSTRTGGIPEIVNQEIGILVPPGDSNVLAKALSEMIESLSNFDRAVIAKKAYKYRPEAVGRLIHSVYESCV